MSRHRSLGRLLYVLVAQGGVWGCGADPAPPTVEIIAQAPATLMVGVDEQNDVSLRLSYTDDNGDLGGGVMELRDCGREEAYALPIPVVASPEVVEDERPISGELIALLPDLDPGRGTTSAFCEALDVAVDTDSLVLCVELVDAAGLRSAGACSAPIALATP